MTMWSVPRVWCVACSGLGYTPPDADGFIELCEACEGVGAVPDWTRATTKPAPTDKDQENQ